MPTQGDYTGTINWNRNAPSRLAVNPKAPAGVTAPAVVKPVAPSTSASSTYNRGHNPKIAARAGGVTGLIGSVDTPSIAFINSSRLAY